MDKITTDHVAKQINRLIHKKAENKYILLKYKKKNQQQKRDITKGVKQISKKKIY